MRGALQERDEREPEPRWRRVAQSTSGSRPRSLEARADGVVGGGGQKGQDVHAGLLESGFYSGTVRRLSIAVKKQFCDRPHEPGPAPPPGRRTAARARPGRTAPAPARAPAAGRAAAGTTV